VPEDFALHPQAGRLLRGRRATRSAASTCSSTTPAARRRTSVDRAMTLYADFE
jgi:hypothetical protein